MDNTWVKLYRKIGDNPIMQDATAIQVFMWLLIHVDKKTGEYTLGRNQASQILNIPPTTFRDALYRLRDKYEIIATLNAGRYTKVSLIRWAKYQSNPKADATLDARTTPGRRQDDATKQDIKTLRHIDNDKSLQRPEFGNQEINSLIGLLKERLSLPLLDDSEKTNRQYANLCIKKFGFEKTKLVIDATAKSKFWHTKITSFKGLYYNAVKIVSSNRGEVRSIDVTKILDSKDEGRKGIQATG